MKCDVGCKPKCTTCRRTKGPVGRDVAPAMSGGNCGCECPGYLEDPQPCDLWPGEERACTCGRGGRGGHWHWCEKKAGMGAER